MNKPISFLILFLFSAVLLSCKKEGCTDKLGVNYDVNVDKEDGSCVFESNLNFWFTEPVSQGLVSSGVQSLFYYSGDEQLGTSRTDVFWEEAPSCEEASAITFLIDQQRNKAKIIQYSVRDSVNNILWSGQITGNAEVCHKIELIP